VVDKTFRLMPTNGAVPASDQKQFAFHINVNDELKFAAASQNGPGQYYMMALTNNAAAGAIGPLITCRSLMQFRDL